jgi:hypothetical protein
VPEIVKGFELRKFRRAPVKKKHPVAGEAGEVEE